VLEKAAPWGGFFLGIFLMKFVAIYG